MNNLYLLSAILGLSIVDSYLTFVRVMLYKKLKIDAKKFELNALTKYLWNKLGLKYGSIVSGAISLCIMFTLCSLFNIYFSFVILGILIITNFLHFSDLNILRNKGVI